MIRPLSQQEAQKQKYDAFNQRFMKPWLASISTRKLPVFYSQTIRSHAHSSNIQIKSSTHKHTEQSTTTSVIKPEQSIFDLGCKKYDSRYKQKMFIEVMKRLQELESTSENKAKIEQLKQLARKCTTYFQINNLYNELSVQNPNIEKIIKRFKIANVPGRAFDSRNKYHHYKLRQSLSLSEIKWNLFNRNEIKRKNTHNINMS